MATRNTPLLREIIEALAAAVYITDNEAALAHLEHHFEKSYVLSAGNTEDVAAFSAQLRLNVTETECGTVLDYIARKEMLGITIDHVETAVYQLFGNRFIEPD